MVAFPVRVVTCCAGAFTVALVQMKHAVIAASGPPFRCFNMRNKPWHVAVCAAAAAAAAACIAAAIAAAASYKISDLLEGNDAHRMLDSTIRRKGARTLEICGTCMAWEVLCH